MEPERKLTAATAAAFQEGVGLVLSRWPSSYNGAAVTRAKRPSNSSPISCPGSITPPVAKKIMIMHGECLDRNFKSIESLREANSRRVPTPHVKQDVDDDEDSDEDDDASMNEDDSTNMIVDKSESHAREPQTKQADEAEDGWEVVGRRRGKGKRN